MKNKFLCSLLVWKERFQNDIKKPHVLCQEKECDFICNKRERVSEAHHNLNLKKSKQAPKQIKRSGHYQMAKEDVEQTNMHDTSSS